VRILIVDTCYPSFLNGHYRRRPELSSQTYADQWRALMDTCFGTFDAYSHHLARLGHEAHEVVANCAPLQRAWAREHGADDDEQTVLLAQVRAFEPDVVYVQNLHYPSEHALREFHDVADLVAGQIASKAPSEDRLRRFDLLLTSFPHFVARLRAVGVDTEYFRIGFDPRILARLEGEEPRERDLGRGRAVRVRDPRQCLVTSKAARALRPAEG
jgi:hypothetical protein